MVSRPSRNLKLLSIKKWGDKKEKRHPFAALTNIKKKENETIEEFNKKFSDMVGRLLADIKLSDTSILIYYTEAFPDELYFPDECCCRPKLAHGC